MRKRLLLVGIIAWTLIIVLAIGIFAVVAKGGFENMRIGSTVIKEESHSLDDFKKLVIKADSLSVKIVKNETDEIKITQYGRKNAQDSEKYKVEENTSTFTVNAKRDFYTQIFNFEINAGLVVALPANWHGSLSVESQSGGISIDDELVLQSAYLAATSGGIHIYEGLASDGLTLESTSGGIYVDGEISVKNKVSFTSNSGRIFVKAPVEADNIKASARSGGIKLGEVKVSSYDISVNSGVINIGSISGGGDIHSLSGGIDVLLSEPQGDVNVSAHSGAIKIRLDRSISFSLTADTASGGIHADFPISKNGKGNHATATVGDAPEMNLVVKATSGSIRILY
jgi:hypothetical protein